MMGTLGHSHFFRAMITRFYQHVTPARGTHLETGAAVAAPCSLVSSMTRGRVWNPLLLCEGRGCLPTVRVQMTQENLR